MVSAASGSRNSTSIKVATLIKNKSEMFKIEVNATICLIVKLFYDFGFWQKDEESSFRKRGKKCSYIFCNTLFIIFLATSAFLCDDKSQSIYLVQLAVLDVVLHVKLLYLLFKKEDVLTFLFDPIVAHSTEDRKEWEQIDKKLKKFMKFLHVYIFMIVCGYVTAIFLSLPSLASDKLLPMFISHSRELSGIVYWMSYVFVALGIACCALFNLMTVLIWYIMLSYSIAYQVLGNRFKRLGMEPKENTKKLLQMKPKGITKKPLQKNSKSTPRNLFIPNLIAIIKDHQNLFEYNF